MTDEPRVDCDITLPDEFRVGKFANAFRLVPDGGEEIFLDFLVYSASEKTASVISRVRIHQSLLPSILKRLSSVLDEIKIVEQRLDLVEAGGLH